MRRAPNRTLFWALAVSLLLHFLVVGSAGRFWSMPSAQLDIPIEAQLVPALAKPPAIPLKPRPRRPAPQPRPVAPPAPPLAPESSPEPDKLPPDLPPPAVPTPPPVEPEPVPAAPPAPAIRPVQRDLPTDLVINYAVQLGDGDNGFVAGRASYIWHSSQGRYSMVSTVHATGLTSLFVRGQIVQVSQGRVNEDGLQPEQYWLERGGKQQDAARFDWSHKVLALAGDRPAQPLKLQAQDLLSFPFQLALTLRADEPDFVLWVTNGRNLRDYNFHVIGLEPVSLPDRKLDALHVQGARVGEGTLDVWLDLAESGLPVRISTRDEKGKTMVLRLEGITGTDGKKSGG
jgi:hypothetical protein